MTTDARFDGPGPEEQWRSALAEGRFTIQHCDECDAWQYPPQALCRTCGAAAPALVEPSGQGAVYSSTTVRSRDGGYNVAIVELAEGPRMMSRVEGDPESVAIGMAVKARIAGGDEPLIVFDPAEGAV